MHCAQLQTVYYTHICTAIYTYIQLYIYTYTNIRIHIYVHIYTHTQHKYEHIVPFLRGHPQKLNKRCHQQKLNKRGRFTVCLLKSSSVVKLLFFFRLPTSTSSVPCVLMPSPLTPRYTCELSRYTCVSIYPDLGKC